MSLIVPVVFWAMVIKLWLCDGPKVPLVFLGIWLVCLLGFSALGLSGIYFFVLQVIMALLLIAIDKY